MRITKIEVQKKNKQRYSLYSDDVFLFGISEDTLIHFQIGKGSEFTEEKIQAIQDYEEQVQCLFQAYRYLGRRPHLTAELRRKLKLKGYSYSLIESVLGILQEKKYLNDLDFIQLFVREQIRLKLNGPLLIKKKLFEKGADSGIISQVLEKEYPDNQQLVNAQAHLNKKLQSNSKSSKAKIIRFLQQKGFSWEIIQRLEWPEQID